MSGPARTHFIQVLAHDVWTNWIAPREATEDTPKNPQSNRILERARPADVT